MLGESFLRTVRQHRLLLPGDRILVAVSGGPDSIAMTHYLRKMSGELRITLFACHVNHMLRGSESDGDAEFAREFCERLLIPIAVRSLDVPELKAETGLGTQEAARTGRYRILIEEALACGANKIAVAQNLDDQAETVLMRLMRGTGPSGTGGIWPEREQGDGLSLIRPLIGTTRAEIMDYIEMHGLQYRTDPSNMKSVYTRNRIRLELIPLLKEYNPNVQQALARLAELAREESSLLMELAKPMLDSIKPTRTGAALDVRVLDGLSRAGRRYVLRKTIETAFGGLSRIELHHIDRLLEMADGGAKRVELPGGTAALVKKRLVVSRPTTGEALEEVVEAVIPGEVSLSSVKKRVSARVVGVSDLDEPPSENSDCNRAYVDFDVIVLPITIRKRQNGDAFQPLGMQGQKKVKDFLIAAGLERGARDGVPVFVDATGAIVWIGGLRIDDRFKVGRSTLRVLELLIKDAV